MALHRKLHALLVGCVVFGMVVSAGAFYTAAQSRPSKPESSRGGAATRESTSRPDVERFRQRAEAALSAAGPDKGAWGMLVTDAATGEVLYARNADAYFMPASNAKLFTTALALATLGPDYRVRTTVASSGTLDANGVLSGDGVLIGPRRLRKCDRHNLGHGEWDRERDGGLGRLGQARNLERHRRARGRHLGQIHD